MAEYETESEIRSGEAQPETGPEEQDFVTLTIPRQTAIELLNALIINLGKAPGLGSPKGGFSEQAGDVITGSDR